MVDYIIRGVTGYNLQINKIVFLSLKIVFVLANSVDLDEVQHYEAFYLNLYCLPKNTFRSHKYKQD